MTYYIRYVLTDEKSVTLPELEQALKATDPGYEIDGDLVVLDDEEFGQIEINEWGNPLLDSDLLLLREFAQQKQNRDLLLAELNGARSLVIVQAIWSRGYEGTLKVVEPLFDWLIVNRKGLMVDEGGWFYNSDGEVI